MYVNEKLSSVGILERLQGTDVDISYSGVINLIHEAGVMRSRSEATKHITLTETRKCKHCKGDFTIINNAQVYCRTCCPTKRAYQRLKYYDLSQSEFEVLLIKQKHDCALCEEKLVEGGATNLNVDHCHNTGKVRGLLCHRCNMIVGFLDKGHWPDQLHKVKSYIQRSQVKCVDDARFQRDEALFLRERGYVC